MSVAVNDIKGIVAANNVVVFSGDGCPYCRRAVAALEELEIEHVEIKATPAQRSALQQLTGQSSIPNIWVKGTFIGGCNDGPESWMGLMKMVRSGKLQQMLEN
jgi:glutaredoxin 3